MKHSDEALTLTLVAAFLTMVASLISSIAAGFRLGDAIDYKKERNARKASEQKRAA